MKAFTLRIPEEDARQIGEVALVKGKSVAEIIRTGVLIYVQQIQSEPEYQTEKKAKAEELKSRAAELFATA